MQVERGEVWQIGPHVLSCGDIGDGFPLRLLLLIGEEPTLLYSDLPWSSSVAAQYRKDAGVLHPLRFTVLLDGVMEVVAATTGCAFLEASVIPVAVRQMEEAAARRGLVIEDRWETRWQRFDGLLYRVARGTDHEHPALPGPAQEHDQLPLRCIESCTEPGDVVMDVCMGYGLVARHAVKAGRRVVGTEINPRRVAASIEELAALTGIEPKLVGRI